MFFSQVTLSITTTNHHVSTARFSNTDQLTFRDHLGMEIVAGRWFVHGAQWTVSGFHGNLFRELLDELSRLRRFRFVPGWPGLVDRARPLWRIFERLFFSCGEKRLWSCAHFDKDGRGRRDFAKIAKSTTVLKWFCCVRFFLSLLCKSLKQSQKNESIAKKSWKEVTFCCVTGFSNKKS